MSLENEEDMGTLLSKHGNTLELSPSDRKHIRESWSHLKKDMGYNGLRIFVTFFGDYPEHLHYFPFQDKTAVKLETDPMVKLHGLRVMKELDSIVASLEQPETLLHILRKNALNHRKRKIDNIAYDDLRRTIIRTFANLLGGKIFTGDVALSWDKALSAAFHVITDINSDRKCDCPTEEDTFYNPSVSRPQSANSGSPPKARAITSGSPPRAIKPGEQSNPQRKAIEPRPTSPK